MTDFSDLTKAEQDPLWAKWTDEGYNLEEDDEVVAECDGALVGVITGIDKNVGTNNDSTIYTVKTKDHDRPVKFWGSAHIDSQIGNVDIGNGDVIGVLSTGETRPTENGDMQLFDVRYQE